MYRQKAKIMDDAAINRTLARISHEIIERNATAESLLIIGIRRRGTPLAKQIAENIRKFSDIQVEFDEITIHLHRDDLPLDRQIPAEEAPSFSVQNKTIILVDDVLYTGRSVRAAIDTIIAMGRPARIQLAVLIDRGHRELPIIGDYVGKSIPTSKKERIAVRVPQYDPVTEKDVLILEKI